MCGIFGIVRKDGAAVDAELLRAAAKTLAHRGPDGSGILAEGRVGLVHLRLALLDLSERGNQPLWDPEERACLVYNGEVYNYLELRKELEGRGIVFRTGTDTEVILQAILVHGIDAVLPRLQGMFAFAFYDRTKGVLLLARDRFGIKPLVVYEDDDVFLFASEVKAFAPFVRLRPDPLRVTSYLAGFGGPTSGDSLYAGVRFVPPATIVECPMAPGSSSRSRSFHRMSDALDAAADGEANLSDEAAVDLVDREMQHAVEQMLLADARVGGLCSGGVDSSLVLAMARRKHDDLAIFHANVVGPSSEYSAAKSLADHLGLELRAVDVHDADFVDLLPDVVVHSEQPFSYHPNSIPFLKVSRLVRESGVKAVVCGEGADECFLGYKWLAREPFEARRRRATRALARAVRRSGIGRMLLPRAEGDAELLRGILSGFEREVEEDAMTEAYRRKHPGSTATDARTLHLLGYHLRTLLHRNDRLGMAANIEARFPFLDEAVVATAIRLPRKFKIRSGMSWRERSHPFVSTKWVLRRVADRHLPRELSRRPKVGFPVTAYDRMTVAPAFFDGSFVSDHLRLGRADIERILASEDRGWRSRLVMLDAWGKLCLDGGSTDAYRSRLKSHVTFAPEGR